MATLAEIAKHRAATRGIVMATTRDLNRFWATLDLADPAGARDALLRFMPTLTTQYGEVAATVAADWYDDLRASSGAAGRFTAQMAETVPTAVVEARTRFGAQHLWTPTPEQALAFLVGAASEYVLQPGRDTIAQSSMRDPAASGWHRETRPGACKFCRMLAGRGGVYKKATANFAAHGKCHCVAVPSWDASAKEVDARQYVASERTSAMSERQRADHTARVAAFLAEMAD